MNFSISFRYLGLLRMISFKQSHRSLQYNVNKVGTKFVFTGSGGFPLKLKVELTFIFSTFQHKSDMAPNQF